MVRLNVIYTRTGDDGRERARRRDAAAEDRRALRRHGRRGRDELRRSGSRGCTYCGATDPTLAAIEATLARVQNDLFDLGADLCLPPAPGEAPGRGAARRALAGRGARARHRRAEREARAPAVLHPAGRIAGLGRAASRPRRLPARRAQRRRARRIRGGGGERRRARLYQPAVGLSLRRRARRQRLRRGTTSCGRPAPTSPTPMSERGPHHRHRRDQRHVDGRDRRGADPQRRRGAGRDRPGRDLSLS